jgi:lantibiotic modifying enzyme
MAKQIFEQTITDERLQKWRLQRRMNDSRKIAEQFNMCRPVIDRALNFGYAKKKKTIEAIDQYFEEREKLEAKTGPKKIDEQ